MSVSVNKPQEAPGSILLKVCSLMNTTCSARLLKASWGQRQASLHPHALSHRDRACTNLSCTHELGGSTKDNTGGSAAPFTSLF